MHAAQLTEQYNKIVSNTMKKYNLSSDWTAVLDTTKEHNGLHFINDKLQQSKTFLIKGEEYALVKEYAGLMEEGVNDLSKSFTLEKGVFKQKSTVNPMDADHISSLNAGFLIKSLIEMPRGGFSHASTISKIMMVAQFTQMGSGVVLDIAKFTSLVKLASNTE